MHADTPAEQLKRAERRWDTLHLALALLFAVGVALFVAQQARLDTLPPMGDDASHVQRAFRLRLLYWGHQGLVDRLSSIFFPPDSYPNGLFILTLATFDAIASKADLIQAINAYLLLHLTLGWWLARQLWGRAAAWAYVLFVALSPLMVFNGHRYNVDTPLAHTVGLSLLALLATRGFSRYGISVIFALVGTLGLLTKWSWGMFVVPPLILVAAIAIWNSQRTLARRAAVGMGIGAAALALVYAMWTLGPDLGDRLYARQYGPGSDLSGRLVALQLAGCALAAGATAGGWWGARHKPNPLWGLGVAAAWFVGVAGPWYLVAQTSLRDRMTHEAGVLAVRSLSTAGMLNNNLWCLRASLPFVEVLLAVGLLAALVFDRRALLHALLAAVAVASGVAAVTFALPFNPRYLLPGVPALAIIAVAGYGGLGRLAWVLTGGVLASGLLATAGLDLVTTSPAVAIRRGEVQQEMTGGATVVIRVFGQRVEALNAPSADDFSGVSRLMADVREACPAEQACVVAVLSREDYFIQGRTVPVLALLNGLDAVSFVPWGSSGPPSSPGAGPQPVPQLGILQPCGQEGGLAGQTRVRRSFMEVIATQVQRYRDGHGLYKTTVMDPVVVGEYALPHSCTLALVAMSTQARLPEGIRPGEGAPDGAAAPGPAAAPDGGAEPGALPPEVNSP